MSGDAEVCSAGSGTPALIARLAAHNLVDQARPEDAVAVVARFGGLQAQDVRGATWAMGARMASRLATDVHAAFDGGDILRTHIFRGTWHFVFRNDIAWLVALVADALIAKNARRYKQLGLDERALDIACTVFAEAVCGGRFKTRNELMRLAGAAGSDASGQRMPYLLQYAELRGILCSGPFDGAQPTYALISERAPDAREPGGDDLDELARRFRQTRGSARPDDFVWWSGLPAGAARAAFERAPPPSSVDDATLTPRAHLLPAFDPYLVDYQHRDAVLDPTFSKNVNRGGGMMAPIVVNAGRVVGTWRHSPASRTLTITPFAALKEPDQAAIGDAAKRYTDFWARTDVEVTFGPARRA